MKIKFFAVPAWVCLWFGGAFPAGAQWQTQSILVKPGWTAVYLHVDPSYTNLDYLVGGDPNNPISEIWQWQPTFSTIQFVTSAQAPITGSSQWSSWVRNGTNASSTLSSLVPNAAYLVHSTAAGNYTWTIKGKPTVPNYSWTASGINLIGFPTVPASPPVFDTFLAPVPVLQSVADIYQYPGGALGPLNPGQVFAPHSVPVTRGQAFWIRSAPYFNNYFGPFQVGLGNGGVEFGDSTSQNSFHLRNTSTLPVTVRLRLLPSETEPAGQTHFLNPPQLVVRGALNSSNLTYTATALTTNGAIDFPLPPQGQPGSDMVILLGVDRIAFANSPAGVYAGILKFTDSFNFTEVDVPVSAKPANYAGLWVGGASLSEVDSYLKIYQRDTNGSPVIGTNNSYVVTGTNTSPGAVAAPYSFRLILHNDGTKVTLLQRVFFGQNTLSNTVLATSENLLDPAKLGAARRISAVQFPWTATNQDWPCIGHLVPGGSLTTTVALPYGDQASNPFLHTYHPDHDNLDASFKNQQPVGVESYDIGRQITMAITSPGSDFESVTHYGQSFSGAYSEAITMTGISAATRTFNINGTFSLTRISPIAVLSRP